MESSLLSPSSWKLLATASRLNFFFLVHYIIINSLHFHLFFRNCIASIFIQERKFDFYITQNLQGREDESFLYLNLIFIYLYWKQYVHIFLPFFHPLYLLWMCCGITSAYLWEGSKLKIAGSAVDYFYCNSEKRGPKVCVCVYIYTFIYTHTKDKYSLKLYTQCQAWEAAFCTEVFPST